MAFVAVPAITNPPRVNAIKFTDEGEVGLKVVADVVEENASELHFIVSDSGVGIAPHEVDMIFDSFNQLDASTDHCHDRLGDER